MTPRAAIEQLEPTYTPTTHRISKAKKGKRVHVCDKCEKVFTRAEHLRRHQLNHFSHAVYRCEFSGCSRTFQRPDLLARHMERHFVRKPVSTKQSQSAAARQGRAKARASPATPLCAPSSVEAAHPVHVAPASEGHDMPCWDAATPAGPYANHLVPPSSVFAASAAAAVAAAATTPSSFSSPSTSSLGPPPPPPLDLFRPTLDGGAAPRFASAQGYSTNPVATVAATTATTTSSVSAAASASYATLPPPSLPHPPAAPAHAPANPATGPGGGDYAPSSLYDGPDTRGVGSFMMSGPPHPWLGEVEARVWSVADLVHPVQHSVQRPSPDALAHRGAGNSSGDEHHHHHHHHHHQHQSPPQPPQQHHHHHRSHHHTLSKPLVYMDRHSSSFFGDLVQQGGESF